jgi:large subunit ribosomal protein L13
MQTPFTKSDAAVAERKWLVVDLEGVTLGRAASKIAHILRGKHKPSFTPHVDDGDFVIALNVHKINLTGRKWDGKMYYRHTGHPGGIKSASARTLNATHPEDLLKLAVKGMLPSGPLGRAQIKKLKMYASGEHPHQAQQPVKLELDKILVKSAN